MCVGHHVFNKQIFGGDKQGVRGLRTVRLYSDAERIGLNSSFSPRSACPVFFLMPQFTGSIGGGGIGGDHATHHLFSAVARHLDMLDGERNLASKLRRL